MRHLFFGGNFWGASEYVGAVRYHIAVTEGRRNGRDRHDNPDTGNV